MLLTEIKLKNFRQFKGEQTIAFSTDKDKNVTVIIGENGSGKTTLAQAFTWCLYGMTDFKNKSVLNLSKAKELEVSGETNVSVELKILHKNTEYTIVRSQVFKKEYSGSITTRPTRLVVRYKDSLGQIETVKESQVDFKIKEILPKELSRYFFFDGERIEKMSGEIQSGKSEEFSEAVRRLLGLNTYTEAIKHLGGKARAGKNSSVIGSYNAEYDSSNDERIRRYSKMFDESQTKIDNYNNRKQDLENTIPEIQRECERLIGIIEKNKDGERLSSERRRKAEAIKKNNIVIDASTGKIIESFQKNYKTFFYKKLIADALQVLSDADKMDKGIPDIHQRTIDYLIKSGTCICGNPICEDSKEHIALMNLLQYIPPHSLGTSISMFAKECKIKTEHTENIYKTVAEILSDVESKNQENEDLYAEIQSLDERIENFESIGGYQRNLSAYRTDLKGKQSELEMVNRKIGEETTKRDRAEAERRNLSLQSDTNKKLAVYLAYAKRIYVLFQKDYSNRENQVRTKLQKSINEIFTTIYDGGLELKIDSKYNVQTIINDESSYNGVLDDTSTSQSISVIFAFIAGVIKEARASQAEKNSDLTSEPYPLVMDAPLSAFDKSRIKTVCDTLPNIAEQVIIFIKDTDGEIAEEYMHDKIGVKYEFSKITETETCLKGRS